MLPFWHGSVVCFGDCQRKSPTILKKSSRRMQPRRAQWRRLDATPVWATSYFQIWSCKLLTRWEREAVLFECPASSFCSLPSTVLWLRLHARGSQNAEVLSKEDRAGGGTTERSPCRYYHFCDYTNSSAYQKNVLSCDWKSDMLATFCEHPEVS